MKNPSRDLDITLVQTDLLWHDPDANRRKWSEKLAALTGKTNLIVLPEMFTSGFTTEIDGLENDAGPTTEWMLQQARATGAALCGSTVFATAQGHANRLLFVTPEGEVTHYDKTHLFRMAGEHKRYIAGTERKIVSYAGWRILLTICYDLRFPVFCRNQRDYDLLLCVANWPQERRQPWRTLLQARAMENQTYVAGVNRVGTDGKGFAYSGDSLMFNCAGESLIDRTAGQEFIATATASAAELNQHRSEFQVWQDADEFDLRLRSSPAKTEAE